MCNVYFYLLEHSKIRKKILYETNIQVFIFTLQITRDVIQEFADDNVKYLELRTTPRAVIETGMTKESYIKAVLKAIKVS